jgi:hypothetical protein
MRSGKGWLEALERELTESLKRRIDLEVRCAPIMLVSFRRYVAPMMSSQLDGCQISLSFKAIHGKKIEVGGRY